MALHLRKYRGSPNKCEALNFNKSQTNNIQTPRATHSITDEGQTTLGTMNELEVTIAASLVPPVPTVPTLQYHSYSQHSLA
jgi:hypothetical protein